MRSSCLVPLMLMFTCVALSGAAKPCSLTNESVVFFISVAVAEAL